MDGDGRRPTPREAFELLQLGNRRFAAGASLHPNQDAARRAELEPGQRPFAALFGCSDSRLAAEIIFDRGLGDLFVVRTAGHILGPEVLGSLEYGLEVLGCPLVVVLGHDSCGAVAAARSALEDGEIASGYVTDVIASVAPSVLAARANGLAKEREVIAEHIRRTVDLLMERSQALSRRVADGRAAMVGMFYRLDVGTAHLVADRGLPIEVDRAGWATE
ncbi:carbonic anhydrase [Streptomyces sp. ICBB 8177]|uniref:carbonic anhydrase n=1 Tax=Streptomyces sp. ICBB 8177 TaxID=563922 RepID=UPI000D681EB9|nr:carbonic anhydrase [Streptomyces sp. ICBB 8177]PWI45044.1 carbonic anhydrase [Streptomyces sp. ICBB 8177]